jgi:hexulose-6-phosphate isomerase
MTSEGRAAIRDLMSSYRISIPSLTGDCFLQEPFWKAEGTTLATRLDAFERIIVACGELGIGCVVVPLVDNGSLTHGEEKRVLIDNILRFVPLLQEKSVMIAFESDFTPENLLRLTGELPTDCFGVNYDMGNSASLGWNPAQEIPMLASRIINVHVKDRLFGGGTVPLGQGSVDFGTVFRMLSAAGYRGNFILQTARAGDGEHASVLTKYYDFVSRAILV